jgi:hypothetical protein
MDRVDGMLGKDDQKVKDSDPSSPHLWWALSSSIKRLEREADL